MYDPSVSLKWIAFAVASFIMIVILGVPVIHWPSLTLLQVFLKGAYCVWGMCLVGCIFDNRMFVQDSDSNDSRSVSLVVRTDYIYCSIFFLLGMHI